MSQDAVTMWSPEIYITSHQSFIIVLHHDEKPHPRMDKHIRKHCEIHQKLVARTALIQTPRT